MNMATTWRMPNAVWDKISEKHRLPPGFNADLWVTSASAFYPDHGDDWLYGVIHNTLNFGTTLQSYHGTILYEMDFGHQVGLQYVEGVGVIVLSKVRVVVRSSDNTILSAYPY